MLCYTPGTMVMMRPPFCWECYLRRRAERLAREQAAAKAARERAARRIRELQERMRRANEDMARIRRTQPPLDDDASPWDPR